MWYGSPPFSLSKDDFVAILKGAALAGLGAAGVYVITKVQPTLELDTTTGALVGAALSVALNVFRKWVSDNR